MRLFFVGSLRSEDTSRGYIMARKKSKGRFQGDVWFRENVHDRVMCSLLLPEPRSQRERRKLLSMPVYKEEYRRQSTLFRQERRDKREEHIQSRMEGEQENLRRAEQDAIWGQAHKNDTEEALLEYVRQCAEERGKSPRMRDVPGGTYISQRFGSWALVLTLAGLKLPRGVEPPSQRTINAYQKQHKENAHGSREKGDN